MIRNFVFDVGDVLIEFRYRDYMRDLGFSEQAVQDLSEKMVLTEYWHEMDLGIHSETDAVKDFSLILPEYRDEIRRFWECPDELVREYPYAAPMLKELKDRGFGVYILSNYPKEMAERHWPGFQFMKYTDGHIISAFEKMCKPDLCIYRLLLERFRLDPAECLFIDDRQGNVDGAGKAGMEALLFTGYDSLKDSIASIENP